MSLGLGVKNNMCARPVTAANFSLKGAEKKKSEPDMAQMAQAQLASGHEKRRRQSIPSIPMQRLKHKEDFIWVINTMYTHT